MAVRERIYQPLPKDSHNIRLLSLLSGSWGEVIRCVVRPVSLEGTPEYEALSYVWGDPKVTAPIILNGCEFSATTNLVAALRRLRLEDRSRTLWVDALCINQMDTDERTHQVGLMEQIYSKAKNALLWLGNAEGESSPSTTRPLPMIFWYSEESCRHHVESFLSIWTRSGEQPALRSDEVRDSQSSLLAAFAFLFILSEMSEEKHFHDLPLVKGDGDDDEGPEWLETASSALGSITGHPWWTRVWTFQEAVLPLKLTVICGNMTAPWSLFVSAGQALNVHDLCCSVLSALGWESLNAINRLRRQMDDIEFYRATEQKTSLWGLMCNVRTRRSTDACDRAYGLLAIADPWENKPLVADYTVAKATLFERLCREEIAASGNLRALLTVVQGANRQSDCPSWVTDWTAEVDELEWQYAEEWIGRYPDYNACADAEEWIEHPATQIMSSGTLSLVGVFIDRVSAVGQMYRLEPGVPSQASDLQFNEWHEMYLNASKVSQYGSPDSCENAYQRTIMSDIICYEIDEDGYPIHNRIQQEDCERFEEWCNDVKSGTAGNEWKEAIQRAVYSGTCYKRFFTTERGYFGLSFANPQPGDEVFVLHGGQVPFVLRRSSQGKGSSATHSLISSCYVHGIMDGEAVKAKEKTEQMVVLQ